MSNVVRLIPVSSGPSTVLQEDAETLSISCDDCAFQHSDRCDDCLVSFVCDLDEGEPLVLGPDERRALTLLTQAGLTPELRLRQRAG